jgi:RimJ/RimL family protein N-acetyltransferase
MKKTIKFATKRLLIRTLQVKDITDEYIHGLNDPEVNRYLVGVRLIPQSYRTVSKFISANLADQNAFLLGMFTLAGEFIGTIRIHEISRFHYSCCLGICLFNRKFWGKGYALEGLRRAVEFIFNDLRLHYIDAGVYKKNTRSVNLFTKAGFTQAAFYKNRYRHNNTFTGVISFAKVNRHFDRLVLLNNRSK